MDRARFSGRLHSSYLVQYYAREANRPPRYRFPSLADLSTFLALQSNKKGELGTAPPEFTLRVVLFLEVPDVLDERLDFIIAQHIAEGFHLGFLPVLYTLLDRLGHRVVLHALLNLGIGIILECELFAHLGLALAIRPVALRAILLPILFSVRRADRSGAHNQERHADYN